MTHINTENNQQKKARARMRKNILFPFFLFILVLFLFPVSLSSKNKVTSQESQASTETETNLLKLLSIIPSPESIDFVQEKTQYQLHTLITEQRHPKTWNLSDRISQDLEAGLRMLFVVDEDISAKLRSLDRDSDVLERAVRAVEGAILSGHKIYLFGCQETGRWTKWVESSVWRPFWRNLQEKKKIWAKVSPKVGDGIESRLIGEMPGADSALINPIGGWEDLMITGRLQLEERGIEPGDVVFCVSASGESPAVIGTIYEALDQWTRRYPYDAEKIQEKLFFIFNNPETVLLPFNRCQAVLEEPGISKINLTTGPQALTGSTRMQASTVDAFLIAQILQTALDRTLRQSLSNKEMANLGFERSVVISEKLEEFSDILREVKKNIPAIAKLTLSSEKSSQEERYTSFTALKGFGTVFNDCVERGSSFHLWPLDTVKTVPRKSRIQVWAPRPNLEEAWFIILGRPFRGLSPSLYNNRLEKEIADRELLQSLLERVKNAEDDQQFLYDFSYSDFNLRNRRVDREDLGILVIISQEEALLRNKDSYFCRFMDDHLEKEARTALLFITEKSDKDIKKAIRKFKGFDPDGKDVLIVLPMDSKNDPLAINQLIALKIILNAHSSAVMARSGRVIGNTITAFDPSYPRSIDRATAMLLSHVNDVLKRPGWVKRHGILNLISYGEANAVLCDTIRFLKKNSEESGRSVDVALCIIRILESLRQKKALPLEEALTIVRNRGLQQYLNDVTTQIN
jgi:N-acetylmuramic acid 6-phosphate etherase